MGAKSLFECAISRIYAVSAVSALSLEQALACKTGRPLLARSLWLGSDSHGGEVFSGKLLEFLTQTGSKTSGGETTAPRTNAMPRGAQWPMRNGRGRAGGEENASDRKEGDGSQVVPEPAPTHADAGHVSQELAAGPSSLEPRVAALLHPSG